MPFLLFLLVINPSFTAVEPKKISVASTKEWLRNYQQELGNYESYCDVYRPPSRV